MDGYDLLYLGHGHEARNGTVRHIVNQYEIRQSVHPLQTHAYILRYTGAVILLKYLSGKQICVPVDNLMRDLTHMGLLSSYCLFPLLVHQGGYKTTVDLRD